MRWLVPCLLLAAFSANADIEWAQKEVTLKVHPLQLYAEAVFSFTNTGDQPAGIDNVAITCGCLSAKPLKKSYAPGESDQLVVRFNLQGRTGMQHKYVLVETGAEARTKLSIVVHIPEIYVAEPQLILWKKGDPAGQKTVRLRNPNAEPIRLLSVTSSLEGLPAELKIIREGFEYEVTVTRNTTGATARSVVRIVPEPPPGQKESKTIKLYVLAQ